MFTTKNAVLSVNVGSSSIKFAVYKQDEWAKPLLSGEIAHIGTGSSTFGFKKANGNKQDNISISAANQAEATKYLLNWFQEQSIFDAVSAIGHRIVHGMQHTQPEIITDELLEELKAISAFDPGHLPDEIKMIEAFRGKYPTLPQIACFDTSFHTSMPPVAKLLSIPRSYQAKGIQRYGFHGLSYAYLMGELKQQAGAEAANGKIILAHLGSGASLAAVENGKSIDTSMGFTPASGLPMGTRTGDIDPGVAWYLMQAEKLNAKQFNHLINHQSGMLGLSETTSDMQDLLQKESTDNRAAEAIEFFCYQTKKWIGSYAAALGGLDTLVFSGGIGEHSAIIRSHICSGLQFLGIELNEAANTKHEVIISTGKVGVRIINTNEELMIAKLVTGALNKGTKNK